MTAYNIPAFAAEGPNPFLREEPASPAPTHVMLAESAANAAMDARTKARRARQQA